MERSDMDARGASARRVPPEGGIKENGGHGVCFKINKKPKNSSPSLPLPSVPPWSKKALLPQSSDSFMRADRLF